MSAGAAVAAVGATAWLGARLLGWRGGLVAGVALLTSIGFFAYGRYVRPETLFVAALAGGFALCLVGIRRRRTAAADVVWSRRGAPKGDTTSELGKWEPLHRRAVNQKRA